jgi:hypothetical protein
MIPLNDFGSDIRNRFCSNSEVGIPSLEAYLEFNGCV